ncbi:ABC transporter ATP-binding protein [Conexibacter sp. CPCC 206217]|uniref:ABC transporter ATP-binding protein n=1 Tax=Conexibacter sp. CPCC 206217 TaxID=3064574 RepID=UPI0027288106|nr:ABC transporter ATP-binding protein [Conexibacter sp. CPCC 206217]MDO8212637.1 ABC transporter ATP-binding protein [Conexibacter sp. CPCC 206217]
MSQLSATSELGQHVSVRGLVKSFPVRGRADDNVVLDQLDLEIEAGEFVSLIGRSGCGKSTLLELIAGLQLPTTGEIVVGEQPVRGPGADRTLVFQQYALFPWRTALQNVMFPLEMAGVGRAERRQLALERLDVVGLSHAADRYAGELSGGMQQRVGLARALACDPQILLLDEPFSGADAITREGLQALLADLHRRFRCTVVLVTHSVDEALRLSDRIVVLGGQPGRVVAEVERTGDGEDAGEMREQIVSLLGD